MRVAVTGGVAEGKSTVMAMIAELGFATASSDAMARQVFLDPPIQSLLAELAGLAEAKITPAELRAAMAGSDELRRQVNRIMHPRIRAAMAAAPADFHEVPLLVEACLYGRYDQVWVVTCGAEEQRRRLVARLGDADAADAIIASQLPTPVKAAFADFVIDSRESLPEVRQKVERLVAATRRPY